MGWGLAAAWLAVIGTTFLTFATGAQALDNLAECEGVINKLEPAARAFGTAVNTITAIGGSAAATFAFLVLLVILPPFTFFLVLMPRKLAGIFVKDGGQDNELVRFLRLSGVWSILMIGSALALAAAAIQLALA